MSRATGWRTTREARTGREGQHRARKSGGRCRPAESRCPSGPSQFNGTDAPGIRALGVSTNYRVDVIKLLRFGNGPMCDFAIVDV